MNKDQVIAELTVGDIPTAIREQIVAEFRTQVQDRDAMIAELQTTVAEFRRQQFDNAVNAKVVELTAWNVTGDAARTKLEAFRRTLRSRLVTELAPSASSGAALVAELAEAAETVWADLQPLAETVRDALAGPPALVGGKGRGNQSWREELAAKAPELRAQYGI